MAILPAFMQQVTNTHVKRWKEHRREIGYGHLYQGRYKCFPVETEAELAALRCCVNRGRPFGDPNWITDTAKRLGLEWTLRPRGRPKKET